MKQHFLLSFLLISGLVACSSADVPGPAQPLKCSDLQCEDSLRSCDEGSDGEDASCGGCLEVAQDEDGVCIASCPEGTFNKGDAESPECQAFTLCSAEEYESKKPRPDADRECRPVSVCGEDEYESVAPTAFSDRECRSISACDEDEYESAAPSALSDRECSELSQCEAGEFISTAHTQSSDRKCSPCAEGTFSANLNQDSCSPWTQCKEDEYQSAAPSSVLNRGCTALRECGPDEYESDAPTPISNRECTALRECGPDEYESDAPTPISDRECTTLRECGPDEYESDAPTPTSNRECTTLRDCVPGEYVGAVPVEDADRECTPCGPDEYSEYENAESCRAHSPQCDSDQFEDQIASSSQDRICASLTECGPGEYESDAPTPISDRKCTALRECGPDEYESDAPTPSSDRECTALRECGPYEYEVTPPTPASDRVCDDVPEIEGMVYIPAATFNMGSPSGQFSNERPVTEVTLSPYYISRTPVTVEEYGFCVDAGGCEVPGTSSLCNWGKSDRAGHPVNCVTWHQAKDFCEWSEGRLPTEAQWEYAARGSDGRTYPWGEEEPGDRACWSGLENRFPDLGTCEVGTYPSGQSPFGLEDMAGSVFEWVADWLGDYPGGRVDEPEGPADGIYRVLRGGSWNNDFTDGLRAGFRNANLPVNRSYSYGFRCARGAVFD